MKRIITFLCILCILVGGIVFYTFYQAKEETNASQSKSLPSQITVWHNYWKDQIVPDKQPARIYRLSNKDPGTIMHLTSDTIVINWDNWGTETFKKDKDGIYKKVQE